MDFHRMLLVWPSEDEMSDDDCYGWIPIGFRIRGLIDWLLNKSSRLAHTCLCMICWCMFLLLQMIYRWELSFVKFVVRLQQEQRSMKGIFVWLWAIFFLSLWKWKRRMQVLESSRPRRRIIKCVCLLEPQVCRHVGCRQYVQRSGWCRRCSAAGAEQAASVPKPAGMIAAGIIAAFANYLSVARVKL